MSSEYNSILIAKLYSTTNMDDMEELLEEIAEKSDPIFLYPLYEAYKNNKDSYISHIFIMTLNNINSNEVTQIAIEIGEDPKTKFLEFPYLLDIFDKRNFYEQRALNIAFRGLSIFIAEKNKNQFILYSILGFIKRADMLNKVESQLSKIFKTDDFNAKSREYAFGQWLTIEPQKKLQNIIDNFDSFKKNRTMESVVARVICGWRGTKIEELKNLIEMEGNIKSKQIIARSRENEEEEKKKSSEEKQQTVQKQYSNADLVEKISNLREKINDFSRSEKDIGFSIFPPNEAIFTQLKTASDDATLMKACVTLRDIVQNLNSELGNHGYPNDEIKKLLPNASEEDFNKSLNKLFLFLHAKNYKITDEIYGLKKLNQLLGLLGAHPQSEKDKLIKKLKELNLFDIYQEEAWPTLHQGLLAEYEKSLGRLLNSIKSKDVK